MLACTAPILCVSPHIRSAIDLDYSHPAAIYQQGWFCEGWVSYILCEPLDLVMYPGLLRSVEVTSWSQQYVLKNNLLLSLLVSPSDWKLGEAKNDIDVVIWLPSLNAYMFERKDSIDVLIYIYTKSTSIQEAIGNYFGEHFILIVQAN